MDDPVTATDTVTCVVLGKTGDPEVQFATVREGWKVTPRASVTLGTATAPNDVRDAQVSPACRAASICWLTIWVAKV